MHKITKEIRKLINGIFVKFREHLAKKADTLFLHNLSGILETAVRATNAQYDDVDILKRLDVRLLEVSPGDIGWDVFSLDYRVDGPIKTVSRTEFFRSLSKVPSKILKHLSLTIGPSRCYCTKGFCV